MIAAFASPALLPGVLTCARCNIPHIRIPLYEIFEQKNNVTVQSLPLVRDAFIARGSRDRLDHDAVRLVGYAAFHLKSQQSDGTVGGVIRAGAEPLGYLCQLCTYICTYVCRGIVR